MHHNPHDTTHMPCTHTHTHTHTHTTEHGLGSHDKDDEPLYHPKDDDDIAPLDISDAKPS